MPKLSAVLNKLGKTINLAKPNTYVVPKKPPLNTLIFEKLPDSRGSERITCTIKGPPVAKPVKICSKDELQSIYCPQQCDCKPKYQKRIGTKNIGGGVAKTTLLLIKSLIVGGLVFYTWSEGLWSDTEHTACIYDKLMGYRDVK